LDDYAIHLAVTAHIRHRKTRYDQLLAMGYDRFDARSEVAEQVRDVLVPWEREHGA
jgi:hypothetical protein